MCIQNSISISELYSKSAAAPDADNNNTLKNVKIETTSKKKNKKLFSDEDKEERKNFHRLILLRFFSLLSHFSEPIEFQPQKTVSSLLN